MRPIVTDGVAWSDGLSVCRSVCHSREPCINDGTDGDAVWIVDSGGPKEPSVRCWSKLPHLKGEFWGEKGQPIVKYWDSLALAVQKRLNRSRCRFGCGLGWAKGKRKHMLDVSAHWQRMVNTLEPFTCGCDAASCQITLTTRLSNVVVRSGSDRHQRTSSVLRCDATARRLAVDR